MLVRWVNDVDIYGLTADEATPSVNNKKQAPGCLTTHFFKRSLWITYCGFTLVKLKSLSNFVAFEIKMFKFK
jgi:hypothetical protein